MDNPSDSDEIDKNIDEINYIINKESVFADKMAAKKQHGQDNSAEKDDITDNTGVNECIKDLLDLCNQLETNTNEATKEIMDIVGDIQDTQQENHETKRDLLNSVDFQNEIICLDDVDPIKLIEDDQNGVEHQNDTEKDPLAFEQAEIAEKISNIHISQGKTDEEKEKQFFDIILAEDNKDLYIIPDTKTPISQEENGVKTLIAQEENCAQTVAKKDASISTVGPQIFDTTPAEDNEELCIIPDIKSSISQVEIGVKTQDNSAITEPQIFDIILAEHNYEQNSVNTAQEENGANTLIAQEENGVKTHISQEEHGVKTLIAQEENVVKTLIAQEENDVNTRIAQEDGVNTRIAQEENGVKTVIGEKESDVKTLIAQEENSVNTIIAQDENGVNTPIAQEENGVKTHISQEEHGVKTLIAQEENVVKTLIAQEENDVNTRIAQDDGVNTRIAQEENGVKTVIGEKESDVKTLIAQEENSVNTIIAQDENGVNTPIAQEENGVKTFIAQKEHDVKTLIAQDENGVNTLIAQEDGVNTRIAQEENGVKTHISQDENGVNTLIAQEENGVKTHISQEENGVKTFIAQEEHDVKTLIAQDENGVNTIIAQEENGVKTFIAQEEHDVKTLIAQDENGVNTIIAQEENGVKTFIAQEEHDVKTLIAQDENGVNTIIAQEENGVKTFIAQEEHDVKTLIAQDENSVNTLIAQEENGVKTFIAQEEHDVKTLIAQDENGVNTIIAQEENGVKTFIAQEEHDVKTLIAQDENSVNTLIAQEENGVKTFIAQEEHDVKTLIAQDENGVNTIIAQEENGVKTFIAQEKNDVKTLISEEKGVNTIIAQEENCVNTNTAQEENGVKTLIAQKEISVNTNTAQKEISVNTNTAQDEIGVKTLIAQEENVNTHISQEENGVKTFIAQEEKGVNANIAQEENGVQTVEEKKVASISTADTKVRIAQEENGVKTLIAQEQNGVQTVEKKKDVSASTTEPQILDEDNKELSILPDRKTSISQDENGVKTLIAQETSVQTVTKKKDASISTEEQQIFDITPAEDNEEICIIPDKKTPISQEENGAQQLEELMSSVNNSIESTDNLQIKVINRHEQATFEVCHQCCAYKKCVYKVDNIEKAFLCSETCVLSFRALNKPINKTNVCVNQNIFVRKCAECTTNIKLEDENILSWETLDFCNEDCLCKYQTKICSNCAYCKQTVWRNNLGKYCVRFGFELRQFCRSLCLEEYKKNLKVCTYCQKDISDDTDGFLAPTNDKQFKEFCSKLCHEKYEQSNIKNSDSAPVIKICAVCNNEKIVEVSFEQQSQKTYFCSQPCFIAYKFVKKIAPLQCETCKIYFETDNSVEFSLFYEQSVKHFCCKSCQNIYIIVNRRIIPCSWCKVKKYNFDMIKKTYKTGQTLIMCSLNCLSLFQVSLKAISTKKVKCDFCNKITHAQYYLTMSDATVRNFCTNQCIVNFQNVVVKNKRLLQTVPKKKNDANRLPVITNVQSLANQPQIIHHFIVKAPPLPPMKNAITSCQPIVHTKGTNCRPSQNTKSTQTDFTKERVALIPFPVPIYVPAPLPMYSAPLPVPVPFPLPIPVPVFIPTTRNTAAGILKEMKKIELKIPTDPYEAEMVLMAQMVAGDEQVTNSDSESSCSYKDYSTENVPFIPEHMDSSNSFGDDKMAADFSEPIMDFEDSLTASTIISNSQNENVSTDQESKNETEAKEKRNVATASRKRSKRQAKNAQPAKKGRLKISEMEIPPLQPIQPPENIVKSDANMCLKYMLGVNAWKLWITQKNSELGKPFFCHDILQLTADELNFSLSQFVLEVRKPSGEEYAPDTIFYLCLGIQQYLFENGRIDNIFTDTYYENFTDSLDKIARKFSVLYDDSQYIVTRVEEEHLWEIKQLGVHSPYVLLHTLLYFNTKYFNLTTVEEHMQLTFSNIMRHWNDSKKETAEPKKVFLKFYAPTSIWQSKPHKKRVYEQIENEENSFRCPVKLYEFYLTKTPESVKASRDLFYLAPERSCLPESPKWYTPMPLSPKIIEKMLHRIKMVKEINVAMLAMA